MATRGVIQLQKLTLSYCEHGGSSKVVRDFLASGKIVDWARDHPQVQVSVRVRNGKHPNVRGDYLTSINGGIHQICLKCNKSNTPDVEAILNKLYNRSGRKIKKFTRPIYTDTPSIQGVWTPMLNLHLTDPFPMQIEKHEA